MRELSAATALAALFFVFQAWTAGYGTKINVIPYIHDYTVRPEVFAGSSLDRPYVVDRGGGAPESIDKWMLRFKLYSVDADEMVTLMALAHIHPARAEFDPHMYQYGGAWLYPLGLWFAVLNKVGVLHLGGLVTMLEHPDRINDVYRFGRLFVSLAVAVAGVFLFAAIREAAPLTAALFGEALFFACPATISFSLTMKPHWYALVFVNLALFLMVRAFDRRRLTFGPECVLGAAVGLAVGCAVSFGSFAVLLWLGLVLLVKRGTAVPLALVRVPVVAVIAFVATNPFLFLDRAAAQGEAAQTAAWYAPAVGWASLGAFAWNSLLPGFGVALTGALLVVSFREFVRPSRAECRFVTLSVWAALALAAVLTANMSTWNVNYRYVAYALPAAILLLAAAEWPRKGSGLAVLLILTLIQSVPLKLAMYDENSDTHGTRLAAATWIDEHVPAGSAICAGTSTPVPFDTPPFNFTRFDVNAPQCSFLVRVERYAEDYTTPPGFSVAKQFRPRLSPTGFALVFGHINPQITIYRRG